MNKGPHYQIRFEKRNGYLCAFVDGEQDSLEVSIAYWNELSVECARVGATKLMVIENFPNNVSQVEMFALGEKLPQLGINDVRVAFVDKVEEHHPANKFGELVAVNRGFNSRAFIDQAEAETWLLGS